MQRVKFYSSRSFDRAYSSGNFLYAPALGDAVFHTFKADISGDFLVPELILSCFSGTDSDGAGGGLECSNVLNRRQSISIT